MGKVYYIFKFRPILRSIYDIFYSIFANESQKRVETEERRGGVYLR